MVWWKPLVVFISTALLLTMMAYIYTTVQFVIEPLTLTDVKVDNDPVPFGEPVIMSGKFDRTKLCMTTMDRFVFREPGNLVMRRERLPSGMSGLGETVVRVTMSSNTDFPHLTPGKYLLRIFIHSDCGYRLYTYQVPDVSFEVAN
jgi:hypothetical protein